MYNFFENKKILILVPHQDDEINLAGGLINSIDKNKTEIYIAYSTNGDYSYKTETRYTEAIKSCMLLGIKKENIYFLGYSDQYSNGKSHLYNEKTNWVSKNNNIETYFVKNSKEFCFSCNNIHHKFNYGNFKNDIKELLVYLKTDYIFCVDFDSHCDHRALSLTFEKALGEILNMKGNIYKPRVFKGFAYPTNYFGIEDFNNVNISSTKFVTEEYSLSNVQNPYYDFKDRVRFPVSDNSTSKNLLVNKVFKALSKYKSQIIVERCFSIINGDQIYWQRRTDNLMNVAMIKVSSGDASKLYDFMLFDSLNIMGGNKRKPIIDDFAWKSNEEIPRIEIEFKEEKVIDELNLYKAFSKNVSIYFFKIIINENLIGDYVFGEGLKLSIKFNSIKIKKIKIEFQNFIHEDISLSEIELLQNGQSECQFIKAIINDDFIYDFYCNGKLKNFGVYYFDGIHSKYLNLDDVVIYQENKEIGDINTLFTDFNKKFYMKLRNNMEIKDTFIIKKETIILRMKNYMNNLINYICVKQISLFYKIRRKILKMFNSI